MSTNASVLMAVNCIERDRPCAKSRTIMSAAGVFGLSRPNDPINAAVTSPLTTSTRRKPKARRMGVVAGFMNRLPANIASTSSPDRNAFRPNAI